MNPVRNSIKAIIIANGHILLTKNADNEGVFYMLPGGGQEPGETMIDALKRECLEELGVEVVPGDIELVREYVGAHHEFAEWDADAHQVEFMFRCGIKDPPESPKPSMPDTWQTGAEWVPLARLGDYRIYPKILASAIRAEPTAGPPVYLGDVN